LEVPLDRSSLSASCRVSNSHSARAFPFALALYALLTSISLVLTK
jgi:hypothetical protein